MTQMPSSVPQHLIGYWAITGGDYNLTNEYRADGTVVQHVCGRQGQPMPFRVEKDQLILRIEQPDGEVSEQATRFKVVEDTLTFFDSETSERVFRKCQGGIRWKLRNFFAKFFGRRPWIDYGVMA
jgi:hypothetical protein